MQSDQSEEEEEEGEEKKFIRFQLVVENAPAEEDEEQGQQQLRSHPRRLPQRAPGSAGSYQLLGDVLTRFSDHCTNTVTEASEVPKEEVQVSFTAYLREKNTTFEKAKREIFFMGKLAAWLNYPDPLDGAACGQRMRPVQGHRRGQRVSKQREVLSSC